MTTPMSVGSTISAFAHACDFGSVEDYESLLDEDAVMTTISGSGSGQKATQVVGRTAIVEGAQLRRSKGEIGPHSGRMHLLGPSSVEYKSAHVVRATTHWMLVDLGSQPPAVHVAGYYQDDLVRTCSRWRIVGRKTAILSAPQLAATPVVASSAADARDRG